MSEKESIDTVDKGEWQWVYGGGDKEVKEIEKLCNAVKQTRIVVSLKPRAMYDEGIVTDTLINLEDHR